MNAIEILGGLLRHKSGGSGAGVDILKDIFGDTSPASPQPKASPQRTPAAPPGDFARQIKELEDLLKVGKEPGPTPAQQTRPQEPSPQQSPSAGAKRPQPAPTSWDPAPTPQRAPADQPEDRALVLVRAMVNAAKADGQISQAEQQNILSHIENPSADTIQFLRDESAKPLDVREFAWSVPLGMEEEVFAISMIAIDPDSSREKSYLNDLAQGLRISPTARNAIQQRLGISRV